MKGSGRFPKVFVGVYTLVILVLFAPNLAGINRPGLFRGLDAVWQDTLFQTQDSAVKDADPRLILLAVDDDAGRRYGFPLPRAVYGKALDAMKALGVRTVAFDVLFFEKREGDASLAEATRRFGRAVHLFSQHPKETAEGIEFVTDLPVAPLLKAGRHFGHPDVGHLLDLDGHIRLFQLVHEGVADPLRPGLEAVSLAAATLAADMDVTVDRALEKFGTGEMGFNFRKPREWLRHEVLAQGEKLEDVERIQSPFRRIALGDLLGGKLSAAQRAALKGSIVVIGSTAIGYFDHYPTPFYDRAPGAEFHMNAIDNLLRGDSLRYASKAWTFLLILGAMALTYLLQRFSPPVSAGLAAAAAAGWLAYALVMFRRGLVVDFVAPAFAFVTSYLVLTVHRVLAEGAEKKMIKGLFGQFVAPEVVELLAQDPSKVKLGGEKRDMTVFFLDIAHFTNISEKMDPEALIHFLNKYLSRLSHVILERRGTIDKYIGDCVMAFWNAPVENKDHRADAILAALECQAAIAELNKTLDPGVPEVPAVRIGINSGIVTVGLTGSEKKLQYTVIGDEVNLASRLEGANKFFGSKIIVSESAFQGVSDRVACRTLGRVRVVGKETPIKIYEPVAEKSSLPEAWKKGLPHYEAGIAAYERREYAQALESFQKFAELFPDDAPGQLYLGRCQEYSVLPPDKDWDGVFNLTAK